MRSRLLMFVLVLACSPTSQAHGAASLLALYQSVPAPPPDAATAARWVREGEVVDPQILTLEAQLKSERAALATESSGAALPSNVAAADGSAVSAAVNGYKAYLAANSDTRAPALLLGGRAKWLAGRFSGLRKRVSDPEDLAEIREQELAAYRALFTDWQNSRRSLVARAESELAAAGAPAAVASSPEQRTALARYRAAALGEVEILLGLTRLAVEHAAGLKAADPATIPASANTLWDLMSDPRQRPAP